MPPPPRRFEVDAGDLSGSVLTGPRLARDLDRTGVPAVVVVGGGVDLASEDLGRLGVGLVPSVDREEDEAGVDGEPARCENADVGRMYPGESSSPSWLGRGVLLRPPTGVA